VAGSCDLDRKDEAICTFHFVLPRRPKKKNASKFEKISKNSLTPEPQKTLLCAQQSFSVALPKAPLILRKVITLCQSAFVASVAEQVFPVPPRRSPPSAPSTKTRATSTTPHAVPPTTPRWDRADDSDGLLALSSIFLMRPMRSCSGISPPHQPAPRCGNRAFPLNFLFFSALGGFLR